MLFDVLHLCAGFSLIMASVYLCAMRSRWRLLGVAALVIALL